MKNITVSIPDDLYRRARMRAAEQDRSVSAVVREFLVSYSGAETERERRKRLEVETLATVRSFSGSDRLSRDSLHERDALR